MKPILSIADLVTNPSFGVNIIISESIDKVENGVIVDYSLDSKKVTISLLREYPNRPDTSVKQHVWFWRTNAAANKAFFAKLEEFAYHVHGDLQSDEFKEDFLPLYTAYLNDKLGYGDDPEIINVTYGHDLVAFINFKSEKTTTTYDEAGEPVTSVKTKTHHGRWTLLDPSVDYNNTVVIPRSLFNTAPKFLRLVAETIGVEVDRIFVKEDPTDPNMPSVRVYFDPKDLTYAGSIPVTIPAGGDAIHVYDNVSGLEIEPEEGGEDGEGEEPEQPEVTPPVTPPEPPRTLTYTPVVDTANQMTYRLSLSDGPVNLPAGKLYVREHGTTNAYTVIDFGSSSNNGITGFNLNTFFAASITSFDVYAELVYNNTTYTTAVQKVDRNGPTTISDVEYALDSKTLTALVANASTVSVKINNGNPSFLGVTDGILSFKYFTGAPQVGDVLTLTAGGVTETLTVA